MKLNRKKYSLSSLSSLDYSLDRKSGRDAIRKIKNKPIPNKKQNKTKRCAKHQHKPNNSKHKRKTRPAKKEDHKASTLGKLKSQNKAYKSRSKFIELIENLSIGFSLYLMLKNLIDLSIKHFVYFLSANFFNTEYISLCFYGLFHVTLLSLLIYKFYAKQSGINTLFWTSYISHLLMYTLFGFAQFSSDMTIWDHKRFLNSNYFIELAKFLCEFSVLVLIVVFKYVYNIISNK